MRGWSKAQRAGGARRTLALVAALCALALGSAVAEAKPVEFRLEVAPEVGTLDDTYVATVVLEVPGVAGAERFWEPDFRDFRVLDSQTQRSTSSTIDPRRGQRITTVEIRRYVLEPVRAGRLRIGPAKARLDGDEFETRSRRVVVRSRGSGGTDSFAAFGDPSGGKAGGIPGYMPPDRSLAGEEMFLHAVVDDREVHVGEQVTVTWLLYTRAEVLKFEPKPPRLSSFWSEVLYEPDAYFTYHEDRVGKIPYVVAIVSKRALFPTKSGTLEVPPFEARVSTLSTALGDSESLRSNSLELTVKPLPADAPPGFDPTYVGRFQAEATVDRTHIAAADALTLTLVVHGTGAIRRTEPPVLSFPGFEFSRPRDFEESSEVVDNTVTGRRVYRYWTTPTAGGKQVIPAIEIPYFDPETGRYEVARTRPVAVFVAGDPTAEAAAEEGGPVERLERDIRLIRAGDSVSSRAALELHDSRWFWILAVLPPFFFGVVVAADRLRERLKKETPRARLRRARGRARQRFRVAEIHLRGNRPAKFFAELSRVVTEHVAERVGPKVRSMTRDEMSAFLAEKGFDDTTIKQILDSLETFDFARFAPTAAGPGEMRAALRRTKELLRRIERTRLAGEPGEEEVA